jgi:predicted transposase/invertase (TIGR01784 family)
MSDWDNIINSTAERSREEGRLEGQAEERAEIAKKMKGLGVDDIVISQSTGLSLEEIEVL